MTEYPNDDPFKVPSVNLEDLRKAAKISQEEMARWLGVSQSQVSRYEQNPDDVPQGVVNKWRAICGRLSAVEGLSYGAPYEEIKRQRRLMNEYANTAPQTPASELFKDAPTADNFLANIRLDSRKPRVAICGRFDMGKSRMANTLLGGDRLHTAYQPATSIICFIRHKDDRPAWLREDVLILSKGFDLDRADDERHCSDHKVVAGSYDTLKLYGTHGDEAESKQCYAALVFIDSPFLLGCDLLDLPGYGHSESDHGKAEFANHLVDVLIYASAAQGFLDQNDLQFLSGLLKQLPVVENGDNGLPVLRNVYVVATMARMEIDQLENIINKSSSRAFKHLEETLELRCGQPITLADFRQRFFTFLVEDPTRRKLFEDDLSELLGNAYPQIIRERVDRSVIELKRGTKNYWDSWAARLLEALEHRDRAQRALDQHEKAEPERQRRIGGKNERVLMMIESSKEATRSFIKGTLAELVTKDKIETMIRDRYKSNKEEAKSYAASYLNEHVQNRLNKFLAHRADGLVSEIEDLLKDYENAGKIVGGLDVGAVAVPFNAQGVFLGAVAAAGTAGALTAWVAVAAAGSNLGAYLLIPSVVSFLSSIGISVGGTASAISLVAAIGGPFTIFVGLVMAAAILGFALLGSSWQSRLAKRISETLKEKKFLKILTEHADKYWDDTRNGFVTALSDMEQTFQAYVGDLQNLATSTSREEIESLIKKVAESRDFFGGIPWKPAR